MKQIAARSNEYARNFPTNYMSYRLNRFNPV